jgi:hypothetical protein
MIPIIPTYIRRSTRVPPSSPKAACRAAGPTTSLRKGVPTLNVLHKTVKIEIDTQKMAGTSVLAK